jgi:nucleoside-diphosphate-sugar epimerase
MTFILGGRGRLGAALARAHAGQNIISLERDVYEGWSAPGAAKAVADYFAPWAGSDATVYVASGLLDPRLDAQQLAAVNLELPKNVLAGAGIHGLRVVTFGTVMERLLTQQNPYVQSKSALGRHVADLAHAGADVAHVQVHTLFGSGEPSPFMFLGLIANALRAQTQFRMTQGTQLREYHHVDDEARAVLQLIKAGRRGVFDLSSGAPVSLRDLAETTFAAFGASALLELGAIPEPLDENYATVFAPDPLLASDAFRPTLPAIHAYLASCGIAPRTLSTSRPVQDQ